MSNATHDEAYVDLEIRIFRAYDKQQGYPVEITLSGEQEFPRGYAPPDLADWTPGGDPVAAGQQLFDLLFADPKLREAWAEARGQAGGKLRIRLYIDIHAPELHALPWELLHDRVTMLSANAVMPFSRYLPAAMPWGGLIQERPIRILVVISNPNDLERYRLAPVDVALEREILEDSLRQPDTLEEMKLEVTYLEPPVTLARLETELRRGYHILHYLGHGAYSARRQQAALYFQDEAGNTAIVSDDALIQMLARQELRPQLIFLAACQSAVRSTGDAFRGLGPKLVQIGMPAVIAMQDFLEMEMARKLTSAFYHNLLAHGMVDRAINEARSVLLSDRQVTNDIAVAVPVIFLRLKSGQLWGDEVDARGKPPSGQKPKTFWEELILTIEDGRCLPFIGPRVHGRWLPTPADVAALWASEMPDYPFEDLTLGRVAQYRTNISNLGAASTRNAYVETLTQEFVSRLPEELREAMAGADEEESASSGRRGRRRRSRRQQQTLLQSIAAIGWQNLTGDDPNEFHTVLASLELPLYMTTNCDPFMAAALKDWDKAPVREVCRWHSDLDHLPSRFEDDPNYVPSFESPMVYHLLGSDEVPDSPVVTENDMMQFLINTAAETDRIPNYIRGALASNLLLFVGYGLYDWEFQVLMHGLVKNLDRRRSFKHVAVQLEVEEVGAEHIEAVQAFLQQYFQDADINVFWGSSKQFVAELREWWEADA
ncbi:MAG: CHAT domain-containing protein [Anaerolineales bacterium]